MNTIALKFKSYDAICVWMMIFVVDDGHVHSLLDFLADAVSSPPKPYSCGLCMILPFAPLYVSIAMKRAKQALLDLTLRYL